MWSALAWHDLRIRYSRTMLDPLWITVSMAIFVLALALVFSGIFNTAFHQYLPYLTAGLLVWGMISGVFVESATTFTAAQPIILSIASPYSIHVFRALLKQIVIFGHNLLVFVGVAIVFGVPVTWATLLFVPGFILVCITLAWINLFVALIGCRFRDLQPIISSFLQLVFFLTPLIWDRGIVAGKAHALWIDANPFYHLIEVVRAPMLGMAPPLASMVAVLAMAIIGWTITFLFFARFRRRIPYWL